jgi:beta-lactam-binding protein with PASTA domain
VLVLLSLLLHGCGFARLDHLMVARDGGWVQTGGEFYVVREGKRLDVSPGMTLKKDDLIETGPETTATLSFEGDLKGSGDVILFPSTRIRILNPSLDIDFGKIFLKVKGYFSIHFEYGTAGSEGTEYLVEADRSRNVRVTVLEGVVRLSSKNNAWRSQRLVARQQARLTRSQAPETRRLGQDEFNETINEINRVWEGTGRRDIPVIVPDLGSMSQSRAVDLLRRERLRSGQVTRRLTQRAEVGSVVGQQPAANARVPIASRVDLEVEAEPAKVPELHGRSQRDAERRLQRSKLLLGRVEQVLSDGKVGRVVQQQPAAGTVVMTDTAVDIGVVAKSALVPDLRGKMLDEARRQVGQRKLRMAPLDYRITGNVQPDQVLSQHPSPGTRVFSGSEVRLVVEAQSRLVPSLIGQQRHEVESRLGALQLAVGRIQTRRVAHTEAGTVLEQRPASGSRVEPGSRVDLTLAAETATVPHLIGSQYRDALQTLRTHNLQAGRVDNRLDDRNAAGSVIEQYPRSGTLVDPNSSVTLILAEAGVRVPHVVGKMSQQAQSELSQRGLGYTSSYREVQGYAKDTVVNQSVSANTLVRKGTRLHLTLAMVKPKCRVPHVIGQGYEQAVSTLQRSKFNVSVQGRYSDGATISGQSPSGNSQADCSSTVVLTLRAPARKCYVPKLQVNSTGYRQAEQIIKRAGLKMSASGRVRNNAYVTGYSPSAGTQVPCGSTVSVQFWVLE